jgi:hypothetical protein
LLCRSSSNSYFLSACLVCGVKKGGPGGKEAPKLVALTAAKLKMPSMLQSLTARNHQVFGDPRAAGLIAVLMGDPMKMPRLILQRLTARNPVDPKEPPVATLVVLLLGGPTKTVRLRLLFQSMILPMKLPLTMSTTLSSVFIVKIIFELNTFLLWQRL